MAKKDWTVNQHYVPRIYLKGFSPDNNGIYRFDLNRNMPSSKPIPIRSVAFEKNLYEVKDESGNIAFRNYIEANLSQLEGMFAEKYRKLYFNIQHCNNLRGEDLFDEDDIAFWYLYTSIQIIRTPKMIRTAERTFLSLLETPIEPNGAHAIIIGQSFPFFSDCKPTDKSIFNAFSIPLFKMNCYIGIATECNIWTSDNPVCCFAEDFTKFGYDLVLFPVSPEIVLIFTPTKTILEIPQTRNYILTPDNVNDINDNIVFEAIGSVFSKHPFSYQDVAQIMLVQNGEQKRNEHKKR